MAEPMVDRIDEFPKDGRLWWVRWVDRYSVPHGGTATPSVEVVLSPLDATLGEVRKVDLKGTFTATNTLRPIRLFTGYIPRLALGMVFQDGVEVACLPLQTMKIDAEAVQLATHCVMDELPVKPSWWTFPYRVINRRDYYLAGFLKSHTVVVTSRRLTIVLPCHEIFRTMYAADSEIALALTSGPWEMTKTRVIEPSKTGVRTDGRWQIILRAKVRNESANVLANICISEAGRAGANGIYAALLESEGPGYMKVPIPFDVTRLQMEVRGVWLHDEPRKFLALQITSMNWPIAMESTVYHRQNSGDKGVIQTPIDKLKPYAKAGGKPSPDPYGIINTNSNEDPSATSATTNFAVPSIRWSNAPRLEKAKKMESFIYSGACAEDGDGTLMAVSAGTEWHGVTSSGSATYAQERRDPSLRFVEVVEMLERLRSVGEIDHWKHIPHPRPKLVVGDLSVWHFPTDPAGTKKIPGFCYIGRKKRLRSALVCEIEYKGSTIYWLEIEVGQSGGGRRSLIFAAPLPQLTECIDLLLTAVAQNRGVWPSCDALVTAASVTWAESWTHSYIGKTAEKQDGRLNETRALQAIDLVAKCSNGTPMYVSGQEGDAVYAP